MITEPINLYYDGGGRYKLYCPHCKRAHYEYVSLGESFPDVTCWYCDKRIHTGNIQVI